MKPKFTTIELVFLAMAIIGIAATWYFNALFYLETADTSIRNFVAQTVTTLPAKSISADIRVFREMIEHL